MLPKRLLNCHRTPRLAVDNVTPQVAPLQAEVAIESHLKPEAHAARIAAMKAAASLRARVGVRHAASIDGLGDHAEAGSR